MVEMIETFHCPYCRLTILETTQQDRERHLKACKKGAENRAAMEYKLGSHSWQRDDSKTSKVLPEGKN